MPADTPRIYVACLASYVQGRLHGAWIEADQDAESIREEIAKMLAASPVPFAEEWSIHDRDGFGGVLIGEHESIERISVVADLLSGYPADVVAAFVNGWGSRPVDELRTAFEDAYDGLWDSRDQYAEEVLAGEDLLAQVPEQLRGCLELELLLHDAELSGELWTVETPGGIHVVRNTY